jgi:hypothetical protein
MNTGRRFEGEAPAVQATGLHNNRWIRSLNHDD